MSGTIRQVIAPAVGRLTKYIKDITPIMKKEILTDQDLVEISHHKKLIEKAIVLIERESTKWSEFILTLPDNKQADEQSKFDDFQFENRHFMAVVDVGRETVDQIEHRLKLLDASSESSHRTEHSVVSHQSRRPNENQNRQNQPHFERIRLPKIELPTFSGDRLKWPTFWQSFETSIHNQPIPAVQKMTYLFSSIKDNALSCVEGYAITGENYPVVIDILKTRYGDSKALSELLESELINLPKANESTSEAIERICRQLKQMGISENSPLIATAIKSKLPYSILTDLVKMEKGKRKSSSSAYDIRRDLQELIAVREEVHRCYKSIRHEKPESSKPSYNPRDNRNKFQSRPNQSRNFVTRAFPVTKPNPRNQTHKRVQSKPHPNRNRPNQTKGCLFCNADHSSYKCLRAPNRESRTKRLAELQRCFKCLKPGHKTPECYSKRGCAQCQGNHHALICPKSENPTQKLTPLQDIRAKDSSNPQSVHTKTTSNLTVQPLVYSMKTPCSPTFLMTKRVLVTSPRSQQPLSAHSNLSSQQPLSNYALLN